MQNETKNCRERCHYSKYCHQKGWDDLNSDDCAWYYKIDDLLNDARYESHDDYDPDEEDEE